MFKSKIFRTVVPLFVVAAFVGLVGCKQPTNSISSGDEYYKVFWDENSKTATVRGNGVLGIGVSTGALRDKVENVVIENGITGIYNWAFMECSNLKSVSIPNSVTYIGEEAFYRCKSLTSVTIPSSVTHIGSGAFRECSSLTSVTVNAVTPPTIDVSSVGESIFDPSPSKIYVPSGSVDRYKNNSQQGGLLGIELGWKIYADKIEAKTN